eukprot:CAMPEP_0201936020 /NCGR_PEP_ID=MMETSP0903-20130614/36675_1 /ASSEMBLY_ACC=CAM_ASM_000552 /TAXON_ID=420261 /ORGANISM="Thalassiosira antarctica, Strain CCMP982" /LENGTH=34 /DNA_ID= /DNA_START= /DNA_END= /DNA_ORIENTATION=
MDEEAGLEIGNWKGRRIAGHCDEEKLIDSFLADD